MKKYNHKMGVEQKLKLLSNTIKQSARGGKMEARGQKAPEKLLVCNLNNEARIKITRKIRDYTFNNSLSDI